MNPCLDCGKDASPLDKACAHCGGKLRGVEPRGLLWTASAAGSVAATIAARPARKALSRKRARQRPPGEGSSGDGRSQAK